ncbi:MAG: GNAT family N-acetyltransferase [Muribaculaceae bacterium]|nr:GNAT family N-acetyltransferase [Muribaculaceae bacterium]
MSHSVTLRAPEPRDIDKIYLWENLTDEAHTTLRTGPLSRHLIEQFVLGYDGELYSQGALRFMIDVDRETVGTIDVFDYDHRARHAFVGIYVTAPYRRRGIGREAIRQAEQYVVRAVGMHSLAALIARDNEASIRLFSASGYNEVGRLEGWLTDGETRMDAILMQHTL